MDSRNWRAWVSALCAAAYAGSAAAQAAPPVTFPEALTREPLLAWLRRETDITPSQVVAVGPSAVTAIVSTFPGGGAGLGPRMVIRAEAVDRAAAARDGALSWHVSVNADCAGRRVQLGETTGYAERNLLGERHILRPAEPEWRAPEPGTPLENVWRAGCEASFRRPLEGDGPDPVVVTAPRRAEAAAAARATLPTEPVSPAPRAEVLPAGPAAAVQILASADPAEARSAIARLGARVQGHTTRIERVEVNGRIWHRALVGGFADRSAAARFCAELKAGGGACFVRAGP